MAVGSYTLCEQFIEDLATRYPLINDIPVEDRTEYVKAIQYLYAYLKVSIPEGIILALRDPEVEPDPSSSDYAQWDRSDVLVFMVIEALLLGDTRYFIKNWTKSVSIDFIADEYLPILAKEVGFRVDLISDRLTTEAANEALRQLIRYSFTAIREMGSVQTVKTLVDLSIRLTGTSVDVSVFELSEPGYVMVQTGGVNLYDTGFDDIRSLILSYRPVGFTWNFREGVIELDFGDGFGWFRYKYNGQVYPYYELNQLGNLVDPNSVNADKYRYRYSTDIFVEREFDIGYIQAAENLTTDLDGSSLSVLSVSGDTGLGAPVSPFIMSVDFGDLHLLDFGMSITAEPLEVSTNNTIVLHPIQ